MKFEKDDYKKDEKPDEKETQKLEELADKFGEKTFNAYDRKVYEKFGGAVFYQYYFYSDHTLCTGFHKINGYYFYFDEETGKKATGWKTIDGKRYYFGLTGAAAVGEFEEDGDKKYTFSNEGVLADGIVKIDAEWKFKKEDGSWAKSEFVTSKEIFTTLVRTRLQLQVGTLLKTSCIILTMTASFQRGCSVMIQGFTTLTRTALRKTSG